MASGIDLEKSFRRNPVQEPAIRSTETPPELPTKVAELAALFKKGLRSALSHPISREDLTLIKLAIASPLELQDEEFQNKFFAALKTLPMQGIIDLSLSELSQLQEALFRELQEAGEAIYQSSRASSYRQSLGQVHGFLPVQIEQIFQPGQPTNILAHILEMAKVLPENFFSDRNLEMVFLAGHGVPVAEQIFVGVDIDFAQLKPEIAAMALSEPTYLTDYERTWSLHFAKKVGGQVLNVVLQRIQSKPSFPE